MHFSFFLLALLSCVCTVASFINAPYAGSGKKGFLLVGPKLGVYRAHPSIVTGEKRKSSFQRLFRLQVKDSGRTTENLDGHPVVNNDTSATIKKRDIFKATMLIAGTTVGGGFLALPQTVVVPLGGFGVTAMSLFGVYLFFLAQSFVLVDCLVRYRYESLSLNGETDGADLSTAIGIPSLARYALGSIGSFISTALLVILMESTLVSQISRAGSLLAQNGFLSDIFGECGDMFQYRMGCAVASIAGVALSFGGKKKTSSDENVEPSKRSLATDANALLTSTFLLSAVLLFKAGSSVADWSHCFGTNSSSVWSLARSIIVATPTMLQLLVYAEVLPNVAEMLQYQTKPIKIAVFVGATIPLILLTGWAALGLALLPLNPATLKAQDPVDILLSNSNASIRTLLLTLATSAIGTTMLGSFLALESAYSDITSRRANSKDEDSSAKGISFNFRLSQLLKVIAIALPPFAISIVSPTVFLHAIDFAGSYPVLLLWGMLPPLIAIRIEKLSENNTDIRGDRKSRKIWYALLGSFSAAMFATSAVPDLGAVVNFIGRSLSS